MYIKLKNKKIVILFFIIILNLINTMLIAQNNIDKINIEEQFEKYYKEWQEYRKNPPPRELIRSTPRCDHKSYNAIINLGIPVLPYILDKMKEGDQSLVCAFVAITKKKFIIKRRKDEKGTPYIIIDEYSNKKLSIAPSYKKLYFWWFEENYKKTPELFNKNYTEYKSIKSKSKSKEKENELKGKLQNIKNLGIIAIPLIIKEIKKGDRELIPVLIYLTDNAVKENDKPEDIVKWWKENKEKYIIPGKEIEVK